MIPYRFYFNTEPFSQGYKIDHRHVPSLDGYRPSDELTLAWVGEIDGEAGLAACEQLFRTFNAPWERPNEYAGPSMSVGDVIVFFPDTTQVVAFACDTFGFKEIPAKPLGNVLQRQPKSWKRSAEKLADYLRAKRDDGEQLTDDEERVLYG